jgi:predicted DNA-binding protein
MNDYARTIHRRARQWRQAHLRLPDKLHQRLEQTAKASERTLAGEIRLRLEQSLSREDGEN